MTPETRNSARFRPYTLYRDVGRISVEPYSGRCATEWDEFVLGRAVNGAFMHTRSFINYHAEGRFRDCSLVFRNERAVIVAVVPACELSDEGARTFYSHRGCTYGGIVAAGKYHTSYHYQEIIDLLEPYLRGEGFDRVVLRLASRLFTSVDTDLAEYMLSLNGYGQYTELSSYIDYSSYKADVVSNFSHGKRSHVRDCIKEGLRFRRIHEDREIADFYRLLETNLEKYDVRPVHSLDELLDFKNKRLRGIVSFYGVYREEEMVAGSMLYDYKLSRTLHTTYLAADLSLGSLSPATFLYYRTIEEAKRQGKRYLSFGISTEQHGTVLNRNLIHSKEEYGSLHSINRTMYKALTGSEHGTATERTEELR